MAQTLSDLGGFTYLYSGQVERAKAALQEAGALWRELGNLPMLANSLSGGCIAQVYAGEYRAAITLAGEAQEISESAGNLWGQSYSRWIAGAAHRELGDVGRAMAVMEECIRLGEEAGFGAAQSHVRAELAALHADLGLVQQAIELAKSALASAERLDPASKPRVLGFLARVCVIAGDLNAASESLAAVGRPSAQETFLLFYVPAFIAEPELALASGDFERAAGAAGELVARLRSYGMRLYWPYAHYLKGRALAGLGRGDAAAEALGAARAEAEALASRWTQWRILAALAELERDPNRAEALRLGARDVVSYIAGHIDRPGARTSFLNRPDVQALHATVKRR
jgi:tetratricopeptide (TPR) repeat protein